MDKNAHDRGGVDSGKVSRRAFLSTGTAGIALVGANAREADSQSVSQPNWDRSADVVIIGAGGARLPAAITARDLGASVIVVDQNFDTGGRRILSGGRPALRGRPRPPAKGRPHRFTPASVCRLR